MDVERGIARPWTAFCFLCAYANCEHIYRTPSEVPKALLTNEISIPLYITFVMYSLIETRVYSIS